MKSLSCADLGLMNCKYVAKGMTDKEVIDKAITHGKAVHPDKMANMEPDEMMAMMSSKVKDEM